MAPTTISPAFRPPATLHISICLLVLVKSAPAPLHRLPSRTQYLTIRLEPRFFDITFPSSNLHVLQDRFSPLPSTERKRRWNRGTAGPPD